jgi:hypothetical protein
MHLAGAALSSHYGTLPVENGFIEAARDFLQVIEN